jgi:ABC-type multidrug transport system ATPase subunit
MRHEMKIVNCEKKYNDKQIFGKLNMELESKIYHLKGKNGVGKSVLCRCILGLENFTKGEIYEKGENVLFLPDTPLGEDWLSIQENIDLLMLYYGLTLDDAEKSRIIEELEISDPEQNYHTVSVGTAVKIGIFLLFIKKNWDLIIIDEALSHLDSNMREKVLDELEQRAIEGTTIIIIDHSMEDNRNTEMWKEIILEKEVVSTTQIIL